MSGLLVAGTTSDAGKSMLTAGICRWLRRRGVDVAPFKAQNMSNNSAIAVDGGEIGRAQALQAYACGLEPSVRFNPVLLKPGSDRTSQVVVLGQATGHIGARNYHEIKERLRGTVLETLRELRAKHEVVICEGAGSPAEINLRAGDLANMGLARAAGLPVIVVGDIDRGGVFAALYGTLALLDADDQALVSGFVINKFRGDSGLLQPGLDALTELTGRPTFGVIPWSNELWLDGEDSLAYDGRVLGRPAPPRGGQWLRVAVVRLPRVSNATDAEALAAEPGVQVRLTVEPADLADVDLVVLPGSKSTVDDLTWLRERGLADAVLAHAAAGRPVLGICGGFQMLSERIFDDVESRRGAVQGLGLLPVEVTFAARKTLGLVTGTGLGSQPVRGYEIHHGVVSRAAEGLTPLIRLADGTGEGAVVGNVFGTHWHGAFETDGFRRAFLTEAARLAGRHGFEVAPDTSFAALRERTVDVLGDLVEEHLDTEALWRLIERGAPSGLPTAVPALRTAAAGGVGPALRTTESGGVRSALRTTESRPPFDVAASPAGVPEASTLPAVAPEATTAPDGVPRAFIGSAGVPASGGPGSVPASGGPGSAPASPGPGSVPASGGSVGMQVVSSGFVSAEEVSIAPDSKPRAATDAGGVPRLSTGFAGVSEVSTGSVDVREVSAVSDGVPVVSTGSAEVREVSAMSDGVPVVSAGSAGVVGRFAGLSGAPAGAAATSIVVPGVR